MTRSEAKGKKENFAYCFDYNPVTRCSLVSSVTDCSESAPLLTPAMQRKGSGVKVAFQRKGPYPSPYTPADSGPRQEFFKKAMPTHNLKTLPEFSPTEAKVFFFVQINNEISIK